MEQIRKDKGVEFAIDNLENAERFSREHIEFGYLTKSIRRELLKIKTITKTGDLCRYYANFEDCTHRYAKDFYELYCASDYTIYPSEMLRDELTRRYPNEVSNYTNIEKDFLIGEIYQHDFLSIVLGGSYGLSFRSTRDPRFCYIVMNEYSSSVNDWSDDENTLYFCPPGRASNQAYILDRFLRKQRGKIILVFDKINHEGFTFFGYYEVAGIEDDKSVLKRTEFVKTSLHANKSFYKNIDFILKHEHNHDETTPCMIADIIIQKANEFDAVFRVQKIKNKHKKNSYYALSFPYGFYELTRNFDPFNLIISNRFPNDSSLPLNETNFYILTTRNKAVEDRVLDINILREDFLNYEQRYFDKLEDMPSSPFFNCEDSDKGTEETETQNINVIAYKKFIVNAIRKDVLKNNANSGILEPVEFENVINFKTNKYFDLSFEGDYPLLDITSPVFCIDKSFTHEELISIIEKNRRIKERLVFIDISLKTVRNLNYDNCIYLVIGLPFISYLSQQYPEIYAQFISPESNLFDNDETSKNSFNEGKNAYQVVREYELALENNAKQFAERINTENSKIVLVTGNGVSIPFGSESWKDLENNLLGQLCPKYIGDCEEIKKFFGESCFFTTDFSYEILNQKNEEKKLYWNALKYSVYRRFSPLLFETESAVKSIAQAKRKYGDRMMIFTYNYDTFLEDAYTWLYKKKGPLLESVVTIDENLPYNPNQVIHLHGLLRLDPKSGEESHEGIILTKSEYLSAYMTNRSKGISFFKKCLNEENNLVLFVGSSMTDMFQMAIIDEVYSASDESVDDFVYALLPVCKLDKTSRVAVYQYFLNKNVITIPFEKFEDLPALIKNIFEIA